MISNELSNIDLENMINFMQLNKYFSGVYSKDDLPTLRKNIFML